MSTPGNAPLGNGALELPPFSLDVQALDLGNEIKAVGLELVETENREPVRGAEGAEIWSEVFPALAASEAFAADFFSHIDRVREFCQARGMEWREAAERCLVIAQPSVEQLRQLFERFAGETFGREAPRALRTRPSKASYRGVAWTPTRKRTRGIPFARFASRKMDGPRC